VADDIKHVEGKNTIRSQQQEFVATDDGDDEEEKYEEQKSSSSLRLARLPRLLAFKRLCLALLDG
jgi:hypothetical protein